MIKFRCWDRKNSRMIYEKDPNFPFGRSDIIVTNSWHEALLRMGYSLMMSFGLPDKNKIDIFTGDFIWLDDVVTESVPLRSLNRVGLLNGCLVFGHELDGELTPVNPVWLPSSQKVCEIAGNVFENPELDWRKEKFQL